MAASYRQFLQDWKHLRSDCAGYRLVIYGERAPKFVLDALVLWLAICYDTYVTHQRETSTSSIGFYNFGRFLLKDHEDIGDIIDNCKAIDEVVIGHLIEPPPHIESPSFKHLGARGWFVQGLLTLLLPTFWRTWADGDQSAFRSLRTVLLFPSRLNYVSKSQKTELLQKWKDVQDKLRDVDPPDLDDRARDSIFGRFHLPDRLIGKHGPGHVAEKDVCLLNQKYYASSYTPRLNYLAREYPEIKHPFGKDVASMGFSRLKFVPKQAGKSRSICMEPAATMYVQQAVKGWLYNVIEGDQHLSEHIKLRRPTKNRREAYLGSIDGSYATVDMSHASDSVSYKLLKKWLRGSEFWRILFLIRTRYCLLPDGTTYDLACYATMGAAQTFPVECLVFAAICEHVIWSVTGRMPARGDYSIHGDDITIRSEFVVPLLKFLVECGFEVNQEKTFWYGSEHQFREACGEHWFDGWDVTPIRIPRSFRGLTPTDPDRSMELVDLCNRLLDDYPKARGVVLDRLLHQKVDGRHKRWFVFTDDFDDSSSLLSRNPDNHHLKEYDKEAHPIWERYRLLADIYTVKWQRRVLVGWAPVLKKTEALRGELRIFEWLRSAEYVDTFGNIPEGYDESSKPRLTPRLPKGSSQDGYRFY